MKNNFIKIFYLTEINSILKSTNILFLKSSQNKVKNVVISF